MMIEIQSVALEAFHRREMIFREGFGPVREGPFLIGDYDQDVGALAVLEQARDRHVCLNA